MKRHLGPRTGSTLVGVVATAAAVLSTTLGVLATRRIQRQAHTDAAAARVRDQRQQRFVADVVHDLRTPLASMLAATDGLHSSDSGDRKRSAELLGIQARRLSTLVEDLLEISRFDAGAAELRPEIVDLQALVTDAVTLCAPDTEIAVSPTGDTSVHGDPRRLHTIVRNLVANALHHGAPPIAVTINGQVPHQVQVAVADSGPGLPTEQTPLIFDRFARGARARQDAAGSGLGLGLAIASENAVLHGGRIEATSSQGAVFTLTVPRGIPIPG